MLSQYDEYPVHQAPRPFAHIPSTDYAWDEGYFFGVFNAEEKAFLLTGMRVNPNTDMIGGYAIVNIAGRQYSVRFSRAWRRQMDTVIGPLRFRFVEPLKTIQLTLDDNDSALAFDLTWTGVAPAYEEEHHYAETRGRVTTDQTRYSQAGEVSGRIRFERRLFDVTPDRWSGNRDHSWGLYAERRPLGGFTELLPPRPAPDVRRALRFWILFRGGDRTGFFHIHESETGEQVRMNDVFGTPFEGCLRRGWDGPPLRLVSARHALRFQPGTRILAGGSIELVDERGERWTLELEVASPPWVPQTMGYTTGSWKDGGTMHTYHGSEELVVEWDHFDFSRQPFDYAPYSPQDPGAGARINADNNAAFGFGTSTRIQGVEYLVKTALHAPDGTVSRGQAHVECFVNGRYDPYGFE